MSFAPYYICCSLLVLNDAKVDTWCCSLNPQGFFVVILSKVLDAFMFPHLHRQLFGLNSFQRNCWCFCGMPNVSTF